MTLIANPCCTQSDMERFFSSAGVVEFSDHDDNGSADSGVVDDCINRATRMVRRYCWKYTPAALASSGDATDWATAIACYHLTTLRGNPPPEGVALRYEQALAEMERVKVGDMRLPDVATRANYSPSFTNLEVDRRFPYSRVRTVPHSSDGIPTTLTQKQVGELPYE